MNAGPGPGRAAGVWIAAAAAAVLASDLWSKRVIERTFRLGEEIVVFRGPVTFKLTHVRNPGVAFGMFADAGPRWRIALFAATVAVAGWFLWSIVRETGRLKAVRVAVGMIAGGAAGNLADRIRYGAVVDFLDFWFGPYHWPTFNVADSSITVGTALLLLALWRARAL